METYLFYFLKASIGIILFYLLYQFVLRKETFYTSNRIFLIIGLVLAVLLPIFPITYISPVAPVNNSDFFTFDSQSLPIVLSSNSEISKEEGFWQITTIISSLYIIGASFFFLRLLLQTAFLLFKFGTGEKLQIDGVTVIKQKHKIMPFSFFKVVFIHIKEYSKEELSNIIAHEKVHIQERHWVDLLIVELLTVVFWMNPIVWLYEKSIKQNHEYLADQGVLLAGYHPGQYQALLINQLMGVKVMGFTNNLNFSLNKKRMEMMKKEKSSGFKKVKLLIMLPLIAMLVFAFAEPEYVVNKVQDEIVTVKDKVANQDDLLTFQGDDLIKVKGKVINNYDQPLEGVNIIEKGTTKGTVTNSNGEFVIESTQKHILVFSYIGYKTINHGLADPNNKELEIVMKKGIYNFILPDMTGINFDKGLPPLPPPKRRDEREVLTIVEKMPYMHLVSYNKIRRGVLSIMEKTQDRGKALVGFTINSNGEVINPYISKSSNSKFLDTSALKIIADLEEWEPGVQRGKKVPVDGTLLVNFN